MNYVNEFIQHPKSFIGREVTEIKQNIMLRKEKFNVQIDNMICELDTFQNECFEKIEAVNLVEKNEDLLDEIRLSLDEWNKNDKRELFVSDDIKRKEIHARAQALDTMLLDRLKEIKMDLLMNKVWIYHENERVDVEFEKELIKFEK